MFALDYLCSSVPVASCTSTWRQVLQLIEPHTPLGLWTGPPPALCNAARLPGEHWESGSLSRDVCLHRLKRQLLGFLLPPWNLCRTLDTAPALPAPSCPSLQFLGPPGVCSAVGEVSAALAAHCRACSWT